MIFAIDCMKSVLTLVSKEGESLCDLDSQPTNPTTHYVVVRANLPRGVMAAQIIHASGESSTGKLKPGTYAIALEAESSEHLGEISAKLKEAGVEHSRIIENQEPYDGELLAIGVRPGPREELRRYFSCLPLVR